MLEIRYSIIPSLDLRVALVSGTALAAALPLTNPNSQL